MYKLTSKLILYRNIQKNAVIDQLSQICRAFDEKTKNADDLISDVYEMIKALLDIAAQYGFDRNLWHNYLAFLILSDENAFSMVCEGRGIPANGSIKYFAMHDFKIFKSLFDFDFTPLEKALGIDCFSVITHYKALPKRDTEYNADVSEAVQNLSAAIDKAEDAQAVFSLVCHFYERSGVGLFGINRAFRIEESGNELKFLPINNAERVRLDDLIGYERQKTQLIQNTQSFCKGNRANNVLLYGDAGTGKSTAVKALINEFHDQGLRMIELYKHQFKDLSTVISVIKKRNHRFIIFIDDLSFEEDEAEYKFLKAVIEGGVESRPDNVLIYATSNRRHLIKETWNDRNDMEFNGEIHRSDTVEEKLSLSGRFGVSIPFSIPNKDEFNMIVKALAARENIRMTDEELFYSANQWEIRHGGVSGRCARQFVDYLKSKEITEC